MISLISVLLLLLVDCVSRFRLELMHISLIASIMSNLTHFHGFQQLVLLSYFIEITFFVCTKRINLNLKQNSNRLVIVAKGFLKLPNLHMLLKQKSPSLLRNLAHRTFGKLPIVFSTKVNLLYLLYLTAHSCYLLHLIKQNCSLKTSKNSNLDDTGISLSVFPSRNNLKLHNISITPKMVKKVITNLDSSKVSGPDYIPLVVLKNCELEISYILSRLFNLCLKESCFPDCWKLLLVVPVFKNVGGMVYC